MVRVKICGIRSLEEARWAVEAGADALGFVFAPFSKRFVSPELVREITRGLPPFVVKVGVFVDSPPSEVLKITQTCGLTAVQLHGWETPEDYREIPVPIIKALRIKVGANSQVKLDDLRGSLAGWVRFVQGILVDSEFQGSFGGTGKVFSWESVATKEILHEIRSIGIPLILAGGLTPANVQEGIRKVQPYAVDVSSGVEYLGKKDKYLIREFVIKAKNAKGR